MRTWDGDSGRPSSLGYSLPFLRKWRFGLLVSLFLFSACGSKPENAGSLGETTYQRVCATCHQPDGLGLPPTFPPLADSEWVTGSKQDLVRIVLHGLRGPIQVNGNSYNNAMAGWGAVLSDEQVAAVLTYVRHTFADSASAFTVAEVAAVRQASGSRRTPWTAAELRALPR